MVYLATCIMKINQIVEVDTPFVPWILLGEWNVIPGFSSLGSNRNFCCFNRVKRCPCCIYQVTLFFFDLIKKRALYISVYPYILHACLFGLIVLNLLNFVFLLLVNYYHCYCYSCYYHSCFSFWIDYYYLNYHLLHFQHS